MSFNKRFFREDQILEFSRQYGFEAFDRWVLSPDASLASDNFARSFIDLYPRLPRGYRKILYSCIKNEEIKFSRDLVKLGLVNTHKGNTEIHKSSISRYSDLFIYKWRNKDMSYLRYLKIID